MRDKLMRVIFEAMVSQGDALELPPHKHKSISELIHRVALSKEAADLAVVYEVAGYLKQNASARAAEALLLMMMNAQAAADAERAERAMWGLR